MKIVMVAVLGVLLFGGLFVLVKWLERGGGERTDDAAPGDEAPPYEAKRAILTDAELRFLEVLEPAVAAVFGHEARIALQVPVGAVVQVKRGLDRGEGQKWRNKIDRKTFDFVVTDARTRVLACVELDDSSHRRADRRERDAFLERACAAAGVRLVRVAGRQNYDLESVATALVGNGGRGR